MSDSRDVEITAEQRYTDGLFARLDDEVAKANERLRHVQLAIDDPVNPDNVDAIIRRETEYHALNAKLDRLTIAQLGLVFGRIDVAADVVENPVPGVSGVDRRYIGRLGLDDRDDNYRTLLIDWRAPMARPFYLATTVHPEGVLARRHIRMRGRTVTDIDDEILGGGSEGSGYHTGDDHTVSGVASESALHAALMRTRTEYMQSIVETIQREQDEIIRDPSRGLVVVHGGPGTGKTAVALHRAAYLLYTFRERLAHTGVLIVGPNPTFLNYISQVLPELGETGVVLSTLGDLFPGVTPVANESLLSREIKGSPEMITILREAVRAYQTVPDSDLRITSGSITLTITPSMVAAARTSARRSRRPHNGAREVFAENLIAALARQLAERIGTDPLGGDNLLSTADVDQLHDDLVDEPQVSEVITRLWPLLTPTTVLAELLSSTSAISVAAAEYDEETQAALFRDEGDKWTAADAALLDELYELIGDLPDAENDTDEWSQELADAENAIDILSSSDSTDNDDDQFEAEILSAADVIDAETLAQRQATTDVRSTAERAAADQRWAYGHVIVDEAQELTPMEWRMIFRRCPSRWMTVVGDTAQTGSPAGADNWYEMLSPHVGDRLRLHNLSVNYRTPRTIMSVAHDVLRIIDPTATPTTSIRDGAPVTFLPSGTEPTQAVPQDDGLVAIIDAACVEDSKGLEYDHVVVVEPADIIAASPQGWQNLYVAITRATQTLTIIGDWPVHPEPA